jgi:ribosome recycling factor
VINDIKNEAKTRMTKSLDAMVSDLARIRTGRAHSSLLDHIRVNYYGSEMPINQLAAISTEDSRTLVINPFDKGSVNAIEKAIMISDLSMTPNTSGTTIRLHLPQMTEERRKEMVKVAKGEAEKARVAMRNIRRDANAQLKELLKAKEISEDDDRKAQEDIQKLTDKFIADADKLLADKEKELLSV